MNAQRMEALIAEAVRDADLYPSEIPAIDLYLDQITSLVGDRHREGAEHFADRELTRTMINNYSKDGLLSPIKGKKYTKEHILQMLLVYEMKNTLSIGEIKRILHSIYALPDYSPALLERIYLRYLGAKGEDRALAADAVRRLSEKESLSPENDEDFLTLILGLSTLSSYLKTVVQVLLDERYPAPDEDREKEDAKRAKAEQKAEQKAEKRAAKEKKKSAAEGGAEES
ncbi:MAG: DUF1836 domain-containing protein [Clostridia bacterium]|nr:DUF1836 domain-containing protein [Clostridia bacterium]